jgi:hypothetical protein
MGSSSLVPTNRIAREIILLRGERVLLDSVLAHLYGVQVKVLNQAVRRNRSRFPTDFMFQLTAEEDRSLRSQTVTLKPSRGAHRKYRPFVFTEQGVAMLSSVLHSTRAVRVNIEIMRAFVQLRRMLVSNAELAGRLDELEKRHDAQFKAVFQAIRELMMPPNAAPRRVGFRTQSRAGSPRPAG